MKVTIEKEGKGYVADVKDWGGSPYVGRGKTPSEALGVWLWFHADKFDIEIEYDNHKSGTTSGSRSSG